MPTILVTDKDFTAKFLHNIMLQDDEYSIIKYQIIVLLNTIYLVIGQDSVYLFSFAIIKAQLSFLSFTWAILFIKSKIRKS